MKAKILLALKRFFFMLLIVTFLFRRQLLSPFFADYVSTIPNYHRNYLRENSQTTSVHSTQSAKRNPSPTAIPTPTSIPSKINQKQVVIEKPETNYQLEPCEDDQEEGCYMIRDAPSETMSTVEELNQAVNSYRASHGLNHLYIDPKICEFADIRSHEVKDHFSHDGFSSHVDNGDYDVLGFTMIAENLWQGSFSGVHIVEFGWDKSDGHRANLQGGWSRGCAGIFEDNAVYLFAN